MCMMALKACDCVNAGKQTGDSTLNPKPQALTPKPLFLNPKPKLETLNPNP